MRARVFGKIPLRQRLIRLLVGCGIVVGALALTWGVGFLWFVTTIPKQVEDETTHSDAIVVLTGGSERLDTGLALLADGLAEKLFISGVHPTVDIPEILKVTSQRPELAAGITLGYAAHTTLGNADEIGRWVFEQKIQSIRLVTGAYHMPRSLLELRRTSPELEVIAHPVFPENVKSWEWWRWRGTAALLATEYSKYLAASIRQMVLRKGPNS